METLNAETRKYSTGEEENNSVTVILISLSVCLGLSFCTCLSVEDHLAQVQVCESLAECYLKQRKQQKAVQLYKQALSALSHCQVKTT